MLRKNHIFLVGNGRKSYPFEKVIARKRKNAKIVIASELLYFFNVL